MTAAADTAEVTTVTTTATTTAGVDILTWL